MQLDQKFELEVGNWVFKAFGDVRADIDGNPVDLVNGFEERNHRFLEEALELVQACGCSWWQAAELVDYVFGRPVGEKSQEVGGVMIALTLLCNTHGISIIQAAKTELARIWTKVDEIRAKQKTKPRLRFRKEVPIDRSPSHEAFYAVIRQQSARVSHLERQRDDLHKSNNDYLNRARKAEAKLRWYGVNLREDPPIQ